MGSEMCIRDSTSGFEELKANLEDYPPEKVAPICGIPAETLKEVARLFAGSPASMILWGMGISQHCLLYTSDAADEEDEALSRVCRSAPRSRKAKSGSVRYPSHEHAGIYPFPRGSWTQENWQIASPLP